MKTILLLFALLSSAVTTAQKDTLAKYNTIELLDKISLDKSKANIYFREVFKRNPSDSLKAVAFVNLGEACSYVDGDDTKTSEYYKKGMALAKKANYTEYYLEALSKLSIYYAMLNKNEEVFQLLAEQRKYRFEKNYDLYTYPEMIYYLMGDFEKNISINKDKIKMAQIESVKKGIDEDSYNTHVSLIKYSYASIANTHNYQGQLDSALFYFKKCEAIKNKSITDSFWYIKAFNLILRKDFDGAISFMDKNYEKYIKKFKADNYQYLYYMALCYQQKGDFQKGLGFAKEALENKTPMPSFQNYELECYKVVAECAEKLGKAEEAAVYNKKYIDISNQVNYAKKAAFMAKLYQQNEVEPLKNELVSTSDSAKLLFWGLGLTGILAGYFAFSAVRSRREKKNFLAIIERLENKTTLKIESETIAKEPVILKKFTEEESNVQKNISPETENNILIKLEDFEKNQRFLEPNISLGALALDFKTNTTYITYVIKKHKNDNLTNYVNKLRIEYIIQKMASQPEYAKYKIEYLAQECGFSSYITFKRIFNKETGMDPSKFITYLKNAKQIA